MVHCAGGYRRKKEMTMEDKMVHIEKLKGYGCFACGTANPIGLNMEFYRNGDAVCSEITLSKQYEGWENMAHGGIVSTLLDEIMSWTVMYFKRSFLVTRKMDIKYIKPVPIETPLIVSGKLGRQVQEPKIEVSGQIRNRAGNLLVRSKGEFVMVPEDKLSTVSGALKEDILRLFRNFS
jgi:acyl-coenzyme A thioesterase PaaI-like protein